MSRFLPSQPPPPPQQPLLQTLSVALLYVVPFSYARPRDRIKLRSRLTVRRNGKGANDRRTRVDQIARVVFHVAADRSEAD